VVETAEELQEVRATEVEQLNPLQELKVEMELKMQVLYKVVQLTVEMKAAEAAEAEDILAGVQVLDHKAEAAAEDQVIGTLYLF
jgi:hypothetical protein